MLRPVHPLNVMNDVKVQAVLRPGEEFATTDLALIAVEPKNTEWRIVADTRGRTETGAVQGQWTWMHRSVGGCTGPAKVLDVTGSATDGSVQVTSPNLLSASKRVDADATIRSKRSSMACSGVELVSERVDLLALVVAT